jgi:cytochrome c oxidase assembly protein subunit 11
MTALTLDQRNKRVGLMALGIALAMLAMGYAAVPLYRIFCQVTGFGGTPQVASAAEAAGIKVTGETISIRFDSNTAPGIPWEFEPEKRTMEVKIGERYLAFYTARNLSDQPVSGQASYNVEPEQTGPFFTKVQCFCFTEQTLKPHEEVRMPVYFFVDPAILEDENAKGVQQITLSYTFFRLEKPTT